VTAREILAYAITHAPPGVKGGPYEAESGPPGEECDSLRDACRWPTTEADARECAVMYLEDHLSWCGDARVIRIVRARPSAEPTPQPSEASAITVLRELVADAPYISPEKLVKARSFLAASGPDPIIRARAALAEQPDPGTLAHLRADLRDAVKRAEKAERERDALRDQIAAAGCEAAHAGERTYECDVARPCGLCRLRTRAEKAERELRDMSERAGDAERERDEAKELARVLEVERDEGRRLHSEADNAKLRAEVERLTAPGEGSLDNGGLVAAITRGGSYRAEDFDVLDLQAAYRLGVAHERARQQPAKDRATDEELEREYNRARRNGAALGDIDGILAVAARVRKEQCLVAQAVGMMPGVRSLTIWHEGPGANTVGVRVNDIKAVMQAPADVPATLARLLGEVSR